MVQIHLAFSSLSLSLSLVSYVSRFTIFSKGHTHNLIFQFCEVSQTSSSPPNLVVSGSQYPSPLDTTDPCLASSPLHILLLFYDWNRHAHHHHLICVSFNESVPYLVGDVIFINDIKGWRFSY